MKFYTFLVVFIFGFIQSANAEYASPKNDNLIIYYFSNSKTLILEPLKIYSNKSLSGLPEFIIDSQKVISFENGKSEYLFKNYYKSNNVSSTSDKDKFSIVKAFPVIFIQQTNAGYAIPIEYKDGDILKVLGRNLFFKVGNKNFEGSFYSYMEWKYTESLDVVRELIKTDKELGKFINAFSECVKNKNAECLIKLDPIFEQAIQAWTLYHDEDACKRFRSGDNNLNFKAGTKYIVNWDLYKEFVDLMSTKIKSDYTSSYFGASYNLNLILIGKSMCGSNAKISLNVTREGEDIRIQVDPLSGE